MQEIHLVYLGISLCLINSGIFSGLNLALMGLSRIRLESEARAGNQKAARVLALRRDSHTLLATLLWGNVAVNVLLTILADHSMTILGAFLFSTFGITIFGEIVPQAYFSRNAIRVGSVLAPLVRFYCFVLWPLARPTGWLLDVILGKEPVAMFGERELRAMMALHIQDEDSEVGVTEGTGALNFLDLDDLAMAEEGEALDPSSVLQLDGAPALPAFRSDPGDPFLRRVQASRQKWVVITDENNEPRLALDADGFLRGALMEDHFDARRHCHTPLVVRDPQKRLGDVVRSLEVHPERPGDDVIDRDLILLWGPQKRIITGADLLGRLMRGIARGTPAPNPVA